MIIKGNWHEVGSAAQCSATLQAQGERFTLEVSGGPTLEGPLSDLRFSDRLGNIERKITLGDGSVFASSDNSSIDEWLKQQADHRQSRWVVFLHSLESNLAWVSVAVVITVITVFTFFRWGVPWVSTQVAHALPHKANEVIAAHSLEFLDDFFFDESELEDERQELIESHFEENLLPLAQTNSDIKYALHFRRWGNGDEAIPNAFALPSGDIILTDKFVELSTHQDEIDAVLFHEMGHIVHRHTLEMVVQGTLVATLIMLITGDSNGLADMGIGLGSLLVSSTYSRDNESQADLYAFNKMLTAGIDPNAFSRIMNAITGHMENMAEEDREAESKGANKPEIELDKAPKNSTKSENGFLDYLSSHPSTDKRIEQAERFSKCFQQGLTICEVNPN